MLFIFALMCINCVLIGVTSHHSWTGPFLTFMLDFLDTKVLKTFEMDKYIIFVSFLKYFIFTYFKNVHCQNCNTRFVEPVDSDYFSYGYFLKDIYVPDAHNCTASCYRHGHCAAVTFDPSLEQCRMFTGYMSTTPGDKRKDGVQYFILESFCGPSNISFPMEHFRLDTMFGLYAKCEQRQVFVGTSDRLFCYPENAGWTPARGTCEDKEDPFTIDGSFLNTVNASVTIVATPADDRFSIMLKALNQLYPLSIDVDEESKTIIRNSCGEDGSEEPEDEMDAPYPFVTGQTFHMEIVSTSLNYLCYVDGQQMFLYEHRLPRDSVDRIKITGALDLLSVLTN